MKRSLITIFLILISATSASTQERVKFPVGVSSKVLGYGHLWAAWRRGYFEREGLDVDVVVMRGTAPAVQALMSRAVPANEQGLLQGALASMTSLTSIVGPPIWAGLFGYFVSSAAPVIVPGAAFFAAAGVFLLALGLARRWFGAARIET